jgi:N-carbamoylputrescine amidase
MARSLAIGLVQLAASGVVDPAGSRQRALDLAGWAFDSDADLVLLPELAVPGYVADRRAQAEHAEQLDGPTISSWRVLAEHASGLICGGFCERDGDDIFNSTVLVGDGEILLHYRKLHLFDAEKNCFSPGDLGLPVAEVRGATIGICVCYDLRFVETLRALALQGAELVLVPTAWLEGFDRKGFDANGLPPQANGALLQANLSQVFVACASQGASAAAPRFLGSSLIGGPTGEVVGDPHGRDGEGFTVTTIDVEEAKRAQRRSELITPRADRRTDVYGLSIGGEVL